MFGYIIPVSINEAEAWAKVNLADAKQSVKTADSNWKIAKEDWEKALKAYDDPEDTDPNKYSDWYNASINAFGDLLNQDGQPRRTIPTKEDIDTYISIYGGSYYMFGALGATYAAEQDVVYYETLIAELPAYKKLVAEVDEQLATVEKLAIGNQNKVKEAENKAKEAHAEYKALFEDVDLTIAAIDNMIKIYEGYAPYSGTDGGLIAVLKSKIKLFLKDDNGVAYNNYEDFKKAMDELLESAEREVLLAARDLDYAKEVLAVYQAGEYNEAYAVERAKELLANAEQDYEQAKARYDFAYAQLKNAIDVLLK
ncbi:MAG: hypothetical protein LUE98_07470 [Tannerellaceae bacterium]|nr:hypothetical protein [Tannerellaceae bacterium]